MRLIDRRPAYQKRLSHAAHRIAEPFEEISDHEMGRGLGWVSLAIGATEVFAPKQLQRLMGLSEDAETANIIRVLGLREIMQGVDILSHDDPTPGVWARVAGDMLDGACLAAAATRTKRPGGFMTVCALVLPVVLADMLLAPRLSRHDA
jgi:hypothetical protein